jgi:beta-phosphoglucomutase
MIIKGFFFDLDGTLVDTHEANFLAYQQAAKRVRGTSLPDELRLHLKAGSNSHAFLPLLVPDITDADIAKINIAKKEIYPGSLHVSQVNEYLVTILKQLSGRHVTVLVTTAKKDNALAVLRHHRIEDLFSFMVFGDDVENMKPHPDAYHLALEKSGLKASEVIAFEDSEKGLAAAETAGIGVVHIKDFA